MMRKGKCKSCQDAYLIIPINTAITAMYALALRYNYNSYYIREGIKMHKKMAKAITGSLMAASMLASTAALFAPMSASAGSLRLRGGYRSSLALL